MILFSNFLLRFKNAKAVINQIKAGEWNAEEIYPGDEIFSATREGYKLWLANGAFFL